MSLSFHQEIQILHVDDDPSITDLTGTFLEREDDRFTVETATSADEGLENITDSPPDCVVSDYNMPGMDGIEFLQAVREEYPDLPFLLFTGKGSEAVASDAISAGVTDYLQKGSGSEQYELLANRIENVVTTHRSQQVAKQRKERLELFFQESPLGAIQWDEDIRVERLNDRAEEIFGYEEEELRGKSWETLVAEDDRDRAGNTVAQLRAAKGGQYAVNRNLRKDGEMRTIEWHNRTVTDGDGAVQSVFSKFQDVTQREERKTELEEYETIVGSLTDAVYVLDEEGRFTYVNDKLVSLVNYNRNTILGNTPDLIKDDDAVKRAEHELGRLLSSDGPETTRFEVLLQPRDSDPILCQDHMGVLPYDGEGFNGSVGTLRNVTDRKKREQELQELKSQYETLAKNFPDGAVFLIDNDLSYVRAGGEELRKVGLSPDNIEGAKPHDLFPDEVADELCHYYQEALKGNANTFKQEYGGKQYQIQTVPVQTDGKNINYVMAVSQNVTERVETQQALEDKNERLEEFASIVSHNLRSPLSVAEGNLELAQETCESDRLDQAAAAIGRSQMLIEDLLTLAQEGDEVDKIGSVDLAELAEESWQTVKTRHATLDTEELQIKADPSRVQELFENLYRNSVEHGGDGVTISVGKMDGGFYVADTGSGIPKADRKQVFKTGYSTTEDGTGFGLRIVKQIADAHGWEITVTESEEGGARFEITGVRKAE